MTVCHRSEFQRSSTWRRFFFEKIFFEKMHQMIWVIIARGLVRPPLQPPKEHKCEFSRFGIWISKWQRTLRGAHWTSRWWSTKLPKLGLPVTFFVHFAHTSKMCVWFHLMIGGCAWGQVNCHNQGHQGRWARCQIERSRGISPLVRPIRHTGRWLGQDLEASWY